MSVLCTFPGRYGDLLWALPTIRALSRRIHAPVDLMIAGEFRSILPLLQAQAQVDELYRPAPYLGRVWADPQWAMGSTKAETPTPPALPYDFVFHLGYRDWPKRALPFETLDNLNRYSEITGSRWTRFWPLADEELDLQTPWITLPPTTFDAYKSGVTIGWSDTHFELKYGITLLLQAHTNWGLDKIGNNPRGQAEARWVPQTWEETTQRIATAQVFLGCCSALHVLAVAVGTPVVLMEPMEARWNPIFYPLGMDGPQVTVVKGHDGNPTFDARHVRAAISAILARRQEA